jgi:hypothetical protein
VKPLRYRTHLVSFSEPASSKRNKKRKKKDKEKKNRLLPRYQTPNSNDSPNWKRITAEKKKYHN